MGHVTLRASGSPNVTGVQDVTLAARTDQLVLYAQLRVGGLRARRLENEANGLQPIGELFSLDPLSVGANWNVSDAGMWLSGTLLQGLGTPGIGWTDPVLVAAADDDLLLITWALDTTRGGDKLRVRYSIGGAVLGDAPSYDVGVTALAPRAEDTPLRFISNIGWDGAQTRTGQLAGAAILFGSPTDAALRALPTPAAAGLHRLWTFDTLAPAFDPQVQGPYATPNLAANGTVAPLTLHGVTSHQSPAQSPGIALAVAPDAATRLPGQSGSAVVSLTRLGGFADGVALAATAPVGWPTPTLSDETLAGADAESTLSYAVPLGTPAGTYPITVTGTATGVTTRTATLTVTVPGPRLAIDTTAVSAEVRRYELSPLPVTRAVANTGTGTLAGLTAVVQGGAVPWLAVAVVGSGNTAAVVLTPRTADLTPGQYTATVRVQASNAETLPRDIPVNITVLAPIVGAPGATTTLTIQRRRGGAIVRTGRPLTVSSGDPAVAVPTGAPRIVGSAVQVDVQSVGPGVAEITVSGQRPNGQTVTAVRRVEVLPAA